MPTNREYAVNLLKWVRGVSEGMLKEWPVEKYCHQTSPADNHPVWVLGHIASTDVWIASLFGAPGVTVPESYGKLFGQGAKPTANLSDYPPVAEVRGHFDRTREALLAFVGKMTDAQLTAPLAEKTGNFATDGLDALLKVSWHEGWHFGQVATLRKSLGLPLIMG